MPLFDTSVLLNVGATAPDFELQNQDGRLIRLYELLQQSWVVLFFYPKDQSPICTREVCSFRDAYQDFQAAGAELLGISSDSTASHQRFVQSHALPYPLLSDPDGRIQTAYGISKTFGLIPGRATFAINPDRHVRMAYQAQFSAEVHMKKALALLRWEAHPYPRS